MGLGPGIAGGILQGLGDALTRRAERRDRMESELRAAQFQAGMAQMQQFIGMEKNFPEIIPFVTSGIRDLVNTRFGHVAQKGKKSPPGPGDVIANVTTGVMGALGNLGKNQGPPKPTSVDLSKIGDPPPGSISPPLAPELRMGRRELPPVPTDLSPTELLAKRQTDAKIAEARAGLPILEEEEKIRARYRTPAQPHIEHVAGGKDGQSGTWRITTADGKETREFVPGEPKPSWITGWISDPDTHELRQIQIDKNHPGTRKFTETGQDVPADLRSVSSAQEIAQERARYWGPFGNYYRAERAKGLSVEDAGRKAAAMVEREFNVRMNATEQRMAIDSFLSGIGPRSSTPTQPASAEPSSKPSARSAGNTGIAQPAYYDQDVSVFIDDALGVRKAGPKESPRFRAGERKLAEHLGVDPVQLATAVVEDKGLAKAIQTNVQREAAIDRLSNAITLHGQNFLDTMGPLLATNSPLLNKPLREWDRKLFSSPEYKAYLLAKVEIKREYGYLAAGGSQSTAQLHEGTRSEMEQLFNDGLTLAEAARLVKQLKIETDSAKKANRQTIEGLRGMITGSLRTGGTVSPVPGATDVEKRLLEKYGGR